MKKIIDREKLRLEKNLTTGNEYISILRFVLPIFLGNIFQQLYQVADSLIVGRLLGKEALAAVGASFGISSIILAAAMGLTLGNSILISRYYGSGKCDKIQDTIDTGMIITLFTAAVIMLAGLTGSELLVRLFRVPEQLNQEVLIYFRILLIGTVPMFGYNSITNFLRGLGDSRTPLYFLIMASFANIVLDVLFVYKFSMGVAGAAAATVIAQLMSFLGIFFYVNRKMIYKIKLWHLRLDFHILWEGLIIGVPAMLQQLFIGFGSSVIQVLINGYGTAVISAYTAASKIDGFALMPAVNIGKAMSNYVAQNIGAGEEKRAARSAKAGFIMIISVSGVISILIYCFPQSLMRLFLSSEEVCRAGSGYLKIVSLFYIIFGCMQLLNGILIGKGKALFSMLSTIGSFCLLQVPAAVLLSKWLGVKGIWIATPIGWMGGALLRLCYYKRDLKRYNRTLIKRSKVSLKGP